MSDIHPGQWRLAGLDVVNWGTFQGHHRVEVARKGFLLTGHSGSGKTSLVDAVSTVLTSRGKLRFNAAAADESTRADDRTLLSYVRGAWRRGTSGDTGEVTTQYLRDGATWSAIRLEYQDGTADLMGRPNTVSLVKLFHVRRGATTPADVKDVALIVTQPLDVLTLEPYARNGLDVRTLKRELPAADVFQNHSGFEQRFRRMLGIESERAILLLHKTQSAKNLGSLDELFRNYMLDEPGTFETARRAVEQFTELREAHEAVVRARQQIEHLIPLEEFSRGYDDAGARLERTELYSTHLDAFTLHWKLDLSRQERSERATEHARAEAEFRLQSAATDRAEAAVRDAQAEVTEHGGGRLENLELRIQQAEERLRHATRAREDLARRLTAAQLPVPESLDELLEAKRSAELIAGRAVEDARELSDALSSLYARRAVARQREKEIGGELDNLRHSRTNISRDLAEARARVCQATGLTKSQLPYAAELLEVRAEYQEWTGAIERVLRPFARVMLVPAAHTLKVSATVDALHLGTLLRFESVPLRADSPGRARAANSLVHRVEIKDGPMAAWLTTELTGRYDYACVDSVEELGRVERGVTLAGQVKRGKGTYEKDDRRAVTDRTQWILGFDPQAKIDSFLELLRAAQQETAGLDQEIRAQERARDQHQDRLRGLKELEAVEWEQIDPATHEAELAQLREQRAGLLAADGDLRAAQHLLSEREQERDRQRAALEALRATVAKSAARIDALDQIITHLETNAPPPVPDALMEPLEKLFHAHRDARTVTAASIDEDSRRVATSLHTQENAARAERHQAELDIAALLQRFKTAWPAAAADLTATVEDRGGYLAVLAELRADRLPEFEERFFELLRRQSQQNMGLLANEIRRAPGEVRTRVEPINDSLHRSPFGRGTFLRIKVEDARPAAAIQFLKDLALVTEGSLAPDQDVAAAEERFAVLSRLMQQLGSSETADRTWRAQCLDTRRHVRFTAEEIDADGAVLDVYDSAQGRSGGQKQKLVVFCLAAALRYQLTSGAEDIPRYGSILMDEAFDKADADFTRMALDSFLTFGFHMILATPLKLLQTLEDYVGGIALVSCTDSQDSHVSPVTFQDLSDDDARTQSAPA